MTTTITTEVTEPTAIRSTGCCPPFQPEAWDGKEFTWHDKRFVKEHVPCFLHIPIGMGRRVMKQTALIEAASAQSEAQPMLADETSAWGTDLYIPVTKPVPGSAMDTLSGTFLTKVFEGPYRDANEWVAQMKAYVAGMQRELDKIYFGYTTCPKCAKAYGKNYVVLFAKLKDPKLEIDPAL
jgi:hypothetical protein